jgi:ABC-2 type transport system permease protein
VWRAIYIGKRTLAGYTGEEMLFYIVVAASMGAGAMMSVGMRLGERNYTGDIAVDLARPVSLPWAFFFSSLGNFLYQLMIKFVPTLLIGLLLIGYVPGVEVAGVLSFLVLLLGGNVLHYWLNLILASFAYRTKSPFGINVFWTSAISFLAGLIVPVAFYPDAIRRFILWTPFPSIAYRPIQAVMGSEADMSGFAAMIGRITNLPVTACFIAEQLVWIAIIIPLALCVYYWNERRVDIQGG